MTSHEPRPDVDLDLNPWSLPMLFTLALWGYAALFGLVALPTTLAMSYFFGADRTPIAAQIAMVLFLSLAAVLGSRVIYGAFLPLWHPSSRQDWTTAR